MIFESIKLCIDDCEVITHKGKSILDAALDAGIYIPHLCHHPDLSPIGACRLCIVEVEGIKGCPPSCVTPAENGMIVRTKTEKTERIRRLAMELMLAGHPADCGKCDKYLNCELQSLKQYLGCEELSVKRRSRLIPINQRNPLFVHDPNKCVVCGRCVRACRELRGVGILFYKKCDKETITGTASDFTLADAGCRFCGACAEVCPTGAIQDKEDLTKGKSRKAVLIPCKYTCPAEIDVPRYIRLIKQEEYSAAAAVIREKVPFPGVLGYVCDRICEDVCRRGVVNEPVSIRELKRFASEHDENNLWQINRIREPSTGKRTAVIGAGPSGLTAAYFLCKRGHVVTVFESLPAAGGMMRFGIPEYRLPRSILDREIEDIICIGVDIKTNTPVHSIDTLFQDGYNVVLIAIGTHQGLKLGIPGADSGNTLLGTDFLRKINMGHKVDIGEKVMVLGGGNVAFDCARVATRLGASQVYLACLESRETMPASDDEISQGEDEGILIKPTLNATRIVCENSKITGVEFVTVSSLSFDEDNSPEIEVVENSEHVIEADTVIFAIGQRPEIPTGFGIDMESNHLISVDSFSQCTSREGVFAAGDAVNGTSSVIKAIASGRKAAIAIDRFLGGNGIIDEKFVADTEPEKVIGFMEGFALMERYKESRIPVEEQMGNFCRVVQDMHEEAATYESKRCLQCDLRLKITPVKFWGNY